MLKITDIKKLQPISIQEYNVHQVNSIAKKYKSYRQKSKGPTFALTYNGTFHTLMKNFGFSKDEAKLIEDNYHKLYEVSDKWVYDKMQDARAKGYVELAFGHRVYTPWIYKIGLDLDVNIVASEYRSASNALGQSWCLLNDRARVEFLDRVDKAGYQDVILPIGAIHDSQYYMIKDDVNLLNWVNINLMECMAWQDHDEIRHDQVHLGGELSVFYPTWADEHEIPNNLPLTDLLTKYMEIKHGN